MQTAIRLQPPHIKTMRLVTPYMSLLDEIQPYLGADYKTTRHKTADLYKQFIKEQQEFKKQPRRTQKEYDQRKIAYHRTDHDAHTHSRVYKDGSLVLVHLQYENAETLYLNTLDKAAGRTTIDLTQAHTIIQPDFADYLPEHHYLRENYTATDNKRIESIIDSFFGKPIQQNELAHNIYTYLMQTPPRYQIE